MLRKALALTASAANSVMAFDTRVEDTLLVWAGDQAREASDFVAVIDFDRGSPRYGKVLRTVPLPPPLQPPHEPHHLGVSHDGRTLALGGLLSILTDGNEVFFFDISDRRHPAFVKSDNPTNATITDEFDALSTGGFSRDLYGRSQRRSSGPRRRIRCGAEFRRDLARGRRVADRRLQP